MIEKMMKEILTHNQGYNCLVLECKSTDFKNSILEQLNKLCIKYNIDIQHHADLNNTAIIIPREALLYFNKLCLKQNYMLGLNQKVLDISNFAEQFFISKKHTNSAEEIFWLKQKVHELEHENSQLKLRMNKLEVLVNKLLTEPVYSANNRYHFYSTTHNPMYNNNKIEASESEATNKEFQYSTFLNDA